MQVAMQVCEENVKRKTSRTPPQESDETMSNNEQGQDGRNEKLVISTACEETGLGTGVQQSLSLANRSRI